MYSKHGVNNSKSNVLISVHSIREKVLDIIERWMWWSDIIIEERNSGAGKHSNSICPYYFLWLLTFFL